jgi:tRNA1Val (adenine37-N6)-methyltransferase
MSAGVIRAARRPSGAAVAASPVADRPPADLLDLGCGIGTVLMLLAWRFPNARGVGIEAQTVSVDLARRSLTWNGIENRCRVVHGDFRDARVRPDMRFDLITGTPPYLTPGHATASHRAQCGPCHFEERAGIEDYCAAAADLLASNGRFVVCAAAAQEPRVFRGATAAGLGIVTQVDVMPRAGKAALFTVYVMSADGHRSAAAVRRTALVVRDRRGQWTSEFVALRDAMGMPSARA